MSENKQQLRKPSLVILAGGKGERLGAVNIPKPLVEIAGKPIIEWQIELAKRYGIEDIFILSYHLADQLFKYLGDGEKWGVRITHIVEPYPLGTAGAIKSLGHILRNDFMIFYGDIVLDIDLIKFIEYHRANYKNTKQIITLVAHPNDHPVDSDLVEVNQNNIVTQLIPKPHNCLNENYLPNLVNAAIYFATPDLFNYITFGEKKDLAQHVIPLIIKRNGNVLSYKTSEYVKDVGTPDRLQHVAKDINSGKTKRRNFFNKQKAIFLDRDGVINKYISNLSQHHDFELLPKVSSAVRKINRSDYLAILVTNQPGLAKGFMDESELKKIHNKMETLLGTDGAYLDDVYYCPHHPQRGFAGEVSHLKVACKCRKPSPGMLLAAMKHYNINLLDSWMIGDNEIDIMAGKDVGCKTILISAAGNRLKLTVTPDHICEDMEAAVKIIGI